MAVGFVLEAVDLAMLSQKPKTWNSDQGSQFTNPQYVKRLDIWNRMDGRGNALDYVFTERLWRSIKYEEARAGLKRYMEDFELVLILFVSKKGGTSQ